MKLFILNRCSYGIGKRVVEAHAMAMEHQINAYRFFILLGLIFADVVTLSFQHRLSMLLDPFWTGFAFVSISISLYIALQTRKAIKAKKFEFEIPYLSVLAEISMVLIFVKSLLSGHIPTPYSIDQGLQIMVLIVMVFNILGALRISKFVIVFQTISFFFILTWGFYRAPLHDALSIYFSAFVLVSGVLSIWIADIIMDSYIAIQNATQANEKLVNANEEIKLQNEEITTQRDQLEFQRDTVLRQSKRITDSIHYAERIQRAVFPQASQLDTVFPKNILFFRPRDIVSGDFIWLQEYDGRVYFALADCTGHGVPGAFMSMLGSSLLTELLRREIATQKIGTRNAAFFLDELRGAVKQALHQTGEVRESKDGMDMAFVIWDKNQMELHFAGANIPMLHYSAKERIIQNIKPDKMPISVYKRENPFHNQIVNISKDDYIFLFSDGITDQFGGDYGNKLTLNGLLPILNILTSVESNTQTQFLTQSIENWQGARSQVDDMLLFGYKI